jgi:hydrogenase expression/formation protein HypC
MQVIEAWEGGALVAGRSRSERIDTRLVACEALVPGQWLLVFQGAARECLGELRAAEIDRTLDLLDAALDGDAALAASGVAFDLPSALPAAQLARLTGQPLPIEQEETAHEPASAAAAPG